MTITTCAVLAKVSDSTGGAPIAGAVITAKLSFYEIDEGQGFVAPRSVIARTDADGQATLNLWPNELGSNSSYYAISIVSPLGLTLKAVAVVPNQPTANLHDICTIDPYPGKPETYLQLGEIRSSIQLVQDDVATRVVADDLASEAGALAVGNRRPGVATKVRDLQKKSEDLPHFRDWNGLTGSGGNDDTSDLQAMFNEVGSSGIRKVIGHAGTFVATAPMQIRKPFWVDGAGVQCPPPTANPGIPSNGTWIHFAHSGVGFDISSSEGGVSFSNFGTRRTQPQPGAGTFTPNNHDFDFVTDNVSDTWFKDMLLLNPSRGIRAKNGGAGRLGIWNLRGQPLIEGVRVDTMYDVCRVHDVHFWPFWALQQKVWDWMIANADAFLSFRNDNAFYSNLFSIFYRKGFVVGGNVDGTSAKLKLINGDFDRGQMAVHILPEAVGHKGSYVNVSSQGESGIGLQNPGVVVDAACELEFVNLDLRVFGGNAIRVNHAGVDMGVTNLRIDEWNTSAAGFPAIEVVNGSTVSLFGQRKITNGHGAAKYGNTGYIKVDEWRAYTPAVTPETGAFTTSGPFEAYGKFVGDSVHLKGQLTIGTPGTSGGSVRMSLPPWVPLPSFRSSGTGREAAIAGTALQTSIGEGETAVSVYTASNGYPAVPGSVLAVDLTYPVF